MYAITYTTKQRGRQTVVVTGVDNTGQLKDWLTDNHIANIVSCEHIARWHSVKEGTRNEQQSSSSERYGSVCSSIPDSFRH